MPSPQTWDFIHLERGAPGERRILSAPPPSVVGRESMVLSEHISRSHMEGRCAQPKTHRRHAEARLATTLVVSRGCYACVAGFRARHIRVHPSQASSWVDVTSRLAQPRPRLARWVCNLREFTTRRMPLLHCGVMERSCIT